MKPGARPPLRSGRLLDQIPERIRYCHYSLRTEQAYVFWMRRFIRFHRLQHPRSMGSAEVEAFLTHLATERHVAPSTHKQALAALLFLYRQVLDIDLPWMQVIGRPKSPVRIPVPVAGRSRHSAPTRGAPEPLIFPLCRQLKRSRALWAEDRAHRRRHAKPSRIVTVLWSISTYFPNESRNPIVRLNTSLPGFDSTLSAQK